MNSKIFNKILGLSWLLTFLIIFYWLFFHYFKPNTFNDITFLNIIVLSSYCFVLYLINKFGKLLSKKYFLFLVFIYTLIFASVYLSLFYTSFGDFFDSQRADTVFYHKNALHYTKLNLGNFIESFLKYQDWDDLGVSVYVRLMYKIIEAPLFIYFTNIILALITSLYLFKLYRFYLNKEDSYLATSLFSLSSFYIYIQVSLFKETIFVFFCVLMLFHAQRYLIKKSFYSIIICLCSLVILSFFRIGTPILIFASYFAYYLLRNTNFKIRNILILSIVVPAIFYLLIPIFLDSYFRYADAEFLMYYVRQSEYGYSLIGQVLISTLSATLGPIPSFIATEESQVSSFYYSGYLIKFLLAPFFLIAMIRIIKYKINKAYPLLIYYLLGSFVFGFALRGFDMRFLITHSFIFYLLVFIGTQNFRIKSLKHKWFLTLSYFFLVVVFFLFNSRF